MIEKIRRKLMRHYLVRALEGEQKRRRVIKQERSLKGEVNIVTKSVSIARRRGTFK